MTDLSYSISSPPLSCRGRTDTVWPRRYSAVPAEQKPFTINHIVSINYLAVLQIYKDTFFVCGKIYRAKFTVLLISKCTLLWH